jgi:hypothetical protein
MLLAIASLLLSRCIAGVEIVEIGNLQFTKTLGGIIAEPADSPLADVQVIEVTSDWQTTIRSTRTDAEGRWSLPTRSGTRYLFLSFHHEKVLLQRGSLQGQVEQAQRERTSHHPAGFDVVDVTVRREKALDSSGCHSRPQPGSLHHRVAEAATSSFDFLLKRDVLSQCDHQCSKRGTYCSRHPSKLAGLKGS